MNTKAILATVAVLGSSTAAMADSHARGTVTVTPPTPSRLQRNVARPIMPPADRDHRLRAAPGDAPDHHAACRSARRVGTAPVMTNRNRDHDRGHGPVVHDPVYRPIVVRPPDFERDRDEPVYQPVYTAPQPVYTPPRNR